MNLLDTAAVLLSLAAIFGYINHRVFKLPTSIGILLIGLVLSVLILLLGDQWPGLVTQADYFVTQIDFNELGPEGFDLFLHHGARIKGFLFRTTARHTGSLGSAKRTA